jgi:hypothetical protein
MLGLPVANIKVSYLQAISSAQGVAKTKARLLTATDLYVFPCSPAPDRFGDCSWLKTFYSPFNGQTVAAYRNKVHELGTYNIGLAYFEIDNATLIVVGNTSIEAISPAGIARASTSEMRSSSTT